MSIRSKGAQCKRAPTKPPPPMRAAPKATASGRSNVVRLPVKPAKSPPKPHPYAWQALLARNRDGGLKASPDNVARVLFNDAHWKGVIALDVFANRIVVTRRPPWQVVPHARPAVPTTHWSDGDTLGLLAWVAQEYQLHVHSKEAHEGVVMVAQTNPVHPVREMLRALPRWPHPVAVKCKTKAAKLKAAQKSVLDTWLVRICGCGDTPYIRAVGAKFLIGMIARVMEPGSGHRGGGGPGCKVDTVPVFEGPQGDKKSSMLRTLATGSRVARVGDWFLETSIQIGTKDAMQQLDGKLIVELGELGSMKHAEVEHIKQWLSSQSDTYRASYGRISSDHPRQCVCAGTTNRADYHKDDTGGRRFWPVRVGAINLDLLERQRDLMLAEALARYEAGERWWMDTPKLVAAQAAEIEMRRPPDLLEGPLRDYLDALPAYRRYTGVTTGEIAQSVMMPYDPTIAQRRPLDLSRVGRGESIRIGVALRLAGWGHVYQTTNGDRRHARHPRKAWKIRGGWIVDARTGEHLAQITGAT